MRLIEENLRKMATLREVNEDFFLGSFRDYDAARYNLQNTIEAMLDICNHVISRMSLEIPKTNADSFRVLCRENILSPHKEETYTAMARFRNRVVHMYDQVDNREVYRILKNNLEDFVDFVKDITRFLEREIGNTPPV